MNGYLKLFTMRNKILKQEKALQAKIAKEFKLDEAIDELMTKDISHKEFDEWMNKLIAKNGTTNY